MHILLSCTQCGAQTYDWRWAVGDQRRKNKLPNPATKVTCRSHFSQLQSPKKWLLKLAFLLLRLREGPFWPEDLSLETQSVVWKGCNWRDTCVVLCDLGQVIQGRTLASGYATSTQKISHPEYHPKVDSKAEKVGQGSNICWKVACPSCRCSDCNTDSSCPNLQRKRYLQWGISTSRESIQNQLSMKIGKCLAAAPLFKCKLNIQSLTEHLAV